MAPKTTDLKIDLSATFNSAYSRPSNIKLLNQMTLDLSSVAQCQAKTKYKEIQLYKENL
jgi:hypothetical protein